MFTGDVILAMGCRPLTIRADQEFISGKLANSPNGHALAAHFAMPIDDVIRFFAVPLFATIAHGKDIYDCFKYDRQNPQYRSLEGVVKLIITPVWFPIKLAAKTLLFGVPCLVVGALHLVLPLRTIIGRVQAGKVYEDGGLNGNFHALNYRLGFNKICEDVFEKWPLKTSVPADQSVSPAEGVHKAEKNIHSFFSEFGSLKSQDFNRTRLEICGMNCCMCSCFWGTFLFYNTIY